MGTFGSFPSLQYGKFIFSPLTKALYFVLWLDADVIYSVSAIFGLKNIVAFGNLGGIGLGGLFHVSGSVQLEGIRNSGVQEGGHRLYQKIK